MSTVALSFHAAHGDLARALAAELSRSRLRVHLDPWTGVPSRPVLGELPADTAALVVFLTPSPALGTWVDDTVERLRIVPARRAGRAVLAVRGAECRFPDVLRDDSFADLHFRERSVEVRRLVVALRDATADDAVLVPDAAPPPSTPVNAPPIEIELGHALYDRLVPRLDDLVSLIRHGLFYELGVPLPAVRVSRSRAVAADAVRLVLSAVPEAALVAPVDMVLAGVDAESLEAEGIPAVAVVQPATGLPAAFVDRGVADALGRRGVPVWDDGDIVILVVSAALRTRLARFVGVRETRAMLDRLARVRPQLVDEVVQRLPLVLLTDVLRRLVTEEVPVRNLRRVLLALASRVTHETDPMWLAEHARAALARTITHRLARGGYEIVVFLLHPELEDAVEEAIVDTPTGSWVDWPEARVSALVEAIRGPVRALRDQGAHAVAILTRPGVRAAVRRLVAPSLPGLPVTCYAELRPDIDIQPVARIGFDGTEHRQGVRVERFSSPLR
ncbi:MAG: FHIPEP family type III secretion protein [Myxococcota bacterium]